MALVLLGGGTCEDLPPRSLRHAKTQREAVHLRRKGPRQDPTGQHLDLGLAASGTVRRERLPLRPPALHAGLRRGVVPAHTALLWPFRGFLLCELSLHPGPRRCPALLRVKRTSRLPCRHRGLSHGAAAPPGASPPEPHAPPQSQPEAPPPWARGEGHRSQVTCSALRTQVVQDPVASTAGHLPHTSRQRCE